MTADIRTAAIRAVDGKITNYAREWFADGAVWAAARGTPTREQIAEELRKHKLINAAVSRKSAFCACNPGLTAGVAFDEQPFIDSGYLLPVEGESK